MVLVAVAAVWLLLGYGITGDRLDAIRTGGTLGVGLGGVVVLWLAVRRQRSVELDLLNKFEAHRLAERVATHNETVAADNRTHQQQVAQAAQDDAAARRITDLYAKAADQLGSDKAPVRLAGLYALERLAQDTPHLRQTIVNVICAYLRMPYTLPVSITADVARSLGRRRKIRPGRPIPPIPQLAAEPQTLPTDIARQEREVRLTAQAILTAHLHSGANPNNPLETFWGHIDLDLTDATLIDVNLDHCTTRTVRFDKATFIGDARFERATFTGNVWCNDATFTGNATFNACVFDGSTARFIRATFTDGAYFAAATFTANTRFDSATFTGPARFDEATFVGQAIFHGATFTGLAGFGEATFTGSTAFGETRFADAADFRGVTLPSTRRVDNDTPSPWIDVTGARFDQGEPPEVSRFVAAPDNVADKSGRPLATE